jgi:outer membrane receptor protein involved in Fe transport
LTAATHRRATARLLGVAVALASTLAAPPAPAETPPPAPPAPPAPAPLSAAPAYETVVTATTTLHGSHLPLDHVPANVQSVSAEDLAEHHSLDLSAFLGEATGSVHINDVQGNPLQPDVQYRGFLASPLLGAPQGLSMYLDGVRLNEPFGDTINWDLIPTNAIRSINVIPGSNPMFGLNTLGGALSLETKTGFSDPGVDASILYGSWARKLARASGGAHGQRFGVFAAAQAFDEYGWRDASPSRAAHAFVSASYQNAGATADLALLAATTTLVGNGPAPVQLQDLDRRAIFTSPDRTENQLFAAILRGERPLATHLALSGTAYVRTNRTRSLNGDQHDWSECKTMPGVLCSTSDAGAETPVLDGAGAAVPFSGAYDAADARTDTRQTSYGGAAQLALEEPLARHENHFFVGVDVGQSRIRFRSATTVASFDTNRATVDTGFLDPASPIAVDSVVNDLGLYATDTWELLHRLFVVLSGRWNLTTLSLDDELGGDLTGDHAYRRLNLGGGVSYQPTPWLGAYASYNESNRAPTAVELTCASPTDPCRLPNAFVSDPPLAQVVARTAEGGVRGRWRRGSHGVAYDLTVYQTANSNDILFITSGAVANQGYFANVGRTVRRGIEASLSGRERLAGHARLEWSLHYTLTDATFETPFSALSATHPDAVKGVIDVLAGAHIPSIPEHVGKAAVTVVSSFGLSAGANVVAQSGQYYRGDEANLLPPVPGYAVVNARAAYQIAAPVSVWVLVNNLFDARYSTFGVLGNPTAVFPSFDDPRFLGPGAPRAAWVGLDLRQ